MKKLLLILLVTISLSSCEKSCYQFNIKTVTDSKYSDSEVITYVKKCDLTAKEARKVADGMASTATTGVGNNKVTVTTTCTYYIK
jgi:hypothetical protein